MRVEQAQSVHQPGKLFARVHDSTVSGRGEASSGAPSASGAVHVPAIVRYCYAQMLVLPVLATTYPYYCATHYYAHYDSVSEASALHSEQADA